MPAFLLIVAAASLLAQGAREALPIAELDGNPGETWSVTGQATIERSPELVRSGAGSLRVTMAPPERWPGIRVPREALRQRGFTDLVFEVLNPGTEDATLWIRVDDEKSRGAEPELHRSSRRLPPGWSTVRLDLAGLGTTSKSRVLDGEALALLVLYANLPKEPFDLVFDALRFERSEAPGLAVEAAAIKAFKKGYTAFADYARRLDLIRALKAVDVPERPALLGRKVLEEEEDARLVREAISVIGTTREPAAVLAAIKAAATARQRGKWRWCEALAAIGAPEARQAVADVAAVATASTDKTAAVLALARENDASILPQLGAELPGSWQLRAARVRALRTIKGGDAFPALTAYLKDEHARVRLDAYEALKALSGRDFGEAVDLWLDWWRANAGRDPDAAGRDRSARSAYGSYYGIPLTPGRIAFVIDVSGSMKAALSPEALRYVAASKHLDSKEVGTRVALAKAELCHAIDGLDERTAFQVVWYGTFVGTWSRGGPRRAVPDAKRDAIGRVRGIDLAGNTNIHGALMAALYPVEGEPFSKTYDESVDTIFLLSDGEPTCGTIVDSRHLVADVLEHDRVRMVRINTIGMGRSNVYLLRELARRTGGTYVDLAR